MRSVRSRSQIRGSNGANRARASMRLGWRRRRQGLYSGRQHPLGEIVDPFEGAAPRCRGDNAGKEQPFDRELAVVPAPPRSTPLSAVGQLGGSQGATVLDLVQHRVDEVCFLTPEEMQLTLAVAGVLAGALHAPAEQGMRGQRQ